MSSYIFYRENNKFDDILNDKNIKKFLKQKIKFSKYFIVLGYNMPKEIESYIMLKYGDDIRSWDHIRKSYDPQPYVDYMPDNNRPDRFKNVYK